MIPSPRAIRAVKAFSAHTLSLTPFRGESPAQSILVDPTRYIFPSSVYRELLAQGLLTEHWEKDGIDEPFTRFYAVTPAGLTTALIALLADRYATRHTARYIDTLSGSYAALKAPITRSRIKPPPPHAGILRSGYTSAKGAPTPYPNQINHSPIWYRVRTWQTSNAPTSFVLIHNVPHIVDYEAVTRASSTP